MFILLLIRIYFSLSLSVSLSLYVYIYSLLTLGSAAWAKPLYDILNGKFHHIVGFLIEFLSLELWNFGNNAAGLVLVLRIVPPLAKAAEIKLCWQTVLPPVPNNNPKGHAGSI